MRTVGVLAVAMLAACGGGQYGYARTYEPTGDEGPYASREVDLSYEDVRRFPDRYADSLLGWFGVVREVERGDGDEARLHLDLRIHQARHLCSDETPGSCRVTISDRTIGPFVARVRIRPEHLSDGPDRLWRGSLVKIYGHIEDAGTDDVGPLLRAEWYRHWPHGTYVTTGARGAMRR